MVYIKQITLLNAELRSLLFFLGVNGLDLKSIIYAVKNSLDKINV